MEIVEPIAKFSDKLRGKEGIGKIFNIGLEDWAPEQSEEAKYDLIWNQWCLGHLTDNQLITFLEKCGKVLKDGGLIMVKENLSTSGDDIFDELDSSVTRYVAYGTTHGRTLVDLSCRTDQKFHDLFRKAKMKVKKTEIQNGLPKELYPVRVYALVPGS